VTTGLLLIAIVPEGHPGAAGPPGPRRVRQGPLAAVVDTAPGRLRPRRRDLLAHQEALAALTAAGPVIPMRFGTVAPDEERVRAHLAAERDHLLAALERLTGRVEFNLKALPAADALAALLRDDAGVRRLRDAARAKPGYEASVKLGEAVASALARRAADAGEEAVRRLRPSAVDCRPGPEVAGCPLNVSFLVAADRAARFRAEADRSAAEWRDRVDLRLTGPLPCYSFVDAASGMVAAGV
jgi:hypothetical protein